MPAALSTEQQWIETIKQLTNEELIGDDCALLPDGSLITTDMLVEGNHFLAAKTSLYDLGWKSVAVNLSDIAAMAGVPQFAVVGLALPGAFAADKFRELYSGISDCARHFGTRIVGGDLTRADQIVISVSLIGKGGAGGVMTRSGARIGDVVITSGDFGASAAGLWLILSETPGFDYCRSRHLRPSPRLSEARDLGQCSGGLGALMDASDGLADALLQIARASGVGIEIDYEEISVHEQTKEVAALSSQDVMDLALYGGEDYELVAAVSLDCFRRLQEQGLPFKKIGSVVEGSEVLLRRGGDLLGAVAAGKSFQHWSAG